MGKCLPVASYRNGCTDDINIFGNRDKNVTYDLPCIAGVCSGREHFQENIYE